MWLESDNLLPMDTSCVVQNVAILAHAITKEEEAVPAIALERAQERERLFEKNPEAHTYTEEEEDGED